MHIGSAGPSTKNWVVKPTRVLLVDDHLVFLETVALRLRAEPDIDVVAAESTSRPVLDQELVLSVDVAVLDLMLGGVDGIELGAQLKRINPTIALVALTASETDEQAAAAIAAGFTGWVSKDQSIADLVTAIQTVRSGETHIPSGLLAAALRRLTNVNVAARHDIERRLRSLSLREKQVLDLLMCGLDRRRISDRLYISPNTVRTHQQHILSKLDVHSVLGAVALARNSQAYNSNEAAISR